jgi:hypothetical protein
MTNEIKIKKVLSHPLVESLTEKSPGKFICKLNNTLGNRTDCFYIDSESDSSEEKDKALDKLHNWLEDLWIKTFLESCEDYKKIEVSEFFRIEIEKLDKNSNIYKIIKYLGKEIIKREEEIDSIYYDQSMNE